MPDIMPVTIPVLPTVATEGALLVHVPPGVGSVKVTGVPMQTLGLPEIGSGEELTVIVFVI